MMPHLTLEGSLLRFPHGTWELLKGDGSVNSVVSTDAVALVLALMAEAGFGGACRDAPARWGEDGSLLVSCDDGEWVPVARLIKHGDDVRSIEEAESLSIFGIAVPS